jgi:hypothetical protein
VRLGRGAVSMSPEEERTAKSPTMASTAASSAASTKASVASAAPAVASAAAAAAVRALELRRQAEQHQAQREQPRLASHGSLPFCLATPTLMIRRSICGSAPSLDSPRFLFAPSRRVLWAGRLGGRGESQEGAGVGVERVNQGCSDTSSADASKEPRALEATGAREAGSSNRPTANLATIQTVCRKPCHA